MWKVNITEPLGIVQHFQKLGGSVVQMEVGDFSFDDVIGFAHLGENFLDFDSTVFLAEKMKATYPSAFLIVEGDLSKLIQRGCAVFNRDVTAQTLGMVASLSVRGIPPIFCSNPGMIVVLAERITAKVLDGKKRELTLRQDEVKRIGSGNACLSLLLGFGIGLSKSQAISDFYHGNTRQVLTDILNNPEVFLKINGIGKETIDSIKSI